MAHFYCKYCGVMAESVADLTAGSCERHILGTNKGRHTLYEAREKSSYMCKHCGIIAKSIAELTESGCLCNPIGKNLGRHEPTL